MLYGTEACPVMSRHKHSLDFVVTHVFMEILGTGSKQIVEDTGPYARGSGGTKTPNSQKYTKKVHTVCILKLSKVQGSFITL